MTRLLDACFGICMACITILCVFATIRAVTS